MNTSAFFRITRHATDRLIERFPEDNSKNLSHSEARSKCLNLVRTGEETKSIFNNTKFMAYLWERYGYDYQYVFIINGKYLFIGIIDRAEVGDVERVKILTVVPSNEHAAGANTIKKFTGGKKKPPEETWSKSHTRSLIHNVSPYKPFANA